MEPKNNQVMARIQVLEASYREQVQLLKEKEEDCQLLIEENRQLKKRVATSERRLERSKLSPFALRFELDGRKAVN